MKRLYTEMMHSRNAMCKETPRVLTKHRRRLTAILLALLLCMAIGSFVSYQEPVGDNVNGRAPNNVSVVPVSGSSRFGAGSERDYLLHRPDGHGNTVRVAIMLTGTRVMDIHCYAIGSAYFADLPVVLVGFGEHYKHIYKYKFFLGAANLAGLNDSDVVLAFDGDIMFSGQDMLPHIDRFIAQSAPSMRELDAKAVREGRAMPPIMFFAEKNCVWPHWGSPGDKFCIDSYKRTEHLLRLYALTHNDTFHPKLNPPSNPLRHINAGVSMQRVWALRELESALKIYMSKHAPVTRGPQWYDDQSIIHALYHDTVEWEVTHDVYNKTSATKDARTQYGLHAGLIAFDWTGQFAIPVSYDQQQYFELSSERWEGNASSTLGIYDAKVTKYLRKLYTATRNTVRFTQRPLTRTFSRTSTINIAPPLLSVKPLSEANNTTPQKTRFYPHVMHYCGDDKIKMLQVGIKYMPWYLPMLFDKSQWEQGRDYLLSMPMELWSATTRVRVRYADVCPQHPFSVRPTWD